MPGFRLGSLEFQRLLFGGNSQIGVAKERFGGKSLSPGTPQTIKNLVFSTSKPMKSVSSKSKVGFFHVFPWVFRSTGKA